MASRLKLNIDWFSQRLLSFPDRAGAFLLPTFHQDDILPVEIQVVEPDPDSNFRTPDISNFAITFSIEDTDLGTVIVYQATWNKDIQLGTFNGLVYFNTAELDTWFGTDPTKTATLKIRRTNSDGSTAIIFEDEVTINANLSGAVPTNPLIGTTPLTVELANQIYCKKRMDPGDSLTMVDVDSTVSRTLSVYKEGGEVVKGDDLANL